MFNKKMLCLLISVLLFADVLGADKFVTKRDTNQSPEYSNIITYPHLFSNSVPAHRKINERVLNILRANSCQDMSTATAETPYMHDVFARIIGLNRRYVGIEVRVRIDCDQPHHPLEGFYHLTFNSKTGEQIDMEDHVPLQSFDPASPELIMNYHQELAELIYDEMRRSGSISRSCYGDIPREMAIEHIAFDYPEISGLARLRNVVIKTSPSLENQECREILRVTYDQVKHYFESSSILHHWLD